MKEKEVKTKRTKASSVNYLKINKKVLKKVDALINNDKQTLNIYNALKNGKTSYFKENRKEDSYFDLSWIELIEETLPHLEKIVERPKLNTKVVRNVVPVELAKKIGSESVQHLASHAQFVKTIDKQGNIIPEKILNIGTEDEYLIYENRMVATLVRHLVLFLTKRYEYIVKYSPLTDVQTLFIKNESDVNDCHVEIETKVVCSRHARDNADVDIETYVKRIIYMKKLVETFNHTSFMQMFNKTRDVHLPLLKTNIIRKNPDYKSCARLLTFISGYDKVGISFVVREGYMELTPAEESYLCGLTLLNFLAVDPEPSEEQVVKKVKTYRPKFISNIDDELFAFNDYGIDPEYVRVDKAYYEREEKIVNKTLRKTPTKEELKHRKEEYDKRKKLYEEEKRIELLKKRKEAEEKAMRKEIARQERIAEQKAKENEEKLRIAREKAEEIALQEARKSIVESAKK